MRVVVKCLSPLAHGAFGPSSGNEVQIRRMTLVGVSGMPRVPCVSGNALRGVLRRLIFRDLFGKCEANRDAIPSPAWDRLYAALANGGHLEKSETRVDPDERRRLRASLPPLSLFGAALYSYMLPGHMSVGILWPWCEETEAAGVVDSEGDLVPAEDLVDEVSHVRHVDREEQDPELSGVTPMPTTMETLATGTILESRVIFADHSTAEERGCLAYGLDRLAALGAKSASGLGRVEVSHDGDPDDLAAYLAWRDAATPDTIRALQIQIGCQAAPSKKKRKK